MSDCHPDKLVRYMGVARAEAPTAMWQELPLLSNCGYAGGLSPDNLAEQLPLMEKAAEGQPVWIDVESGVRTSDVFDLDKVRRFLSIAQPYVIQI